MNRKPKQESGDAEMNEINKIAKKYKIKAFNSIDELLDKCDAVSIASPAQTHYMIAKQALKHSCHLFIEKPITTNVEEAQKIIEIANSCLLYTSPSPRDLSTSRMPSSA